MMFSPDKRIFQEVKAQRGGDLSVFLEVSIGDTVVHAEEGDSLLGPLVWLLNSSASRSFSGVGDQADDVGFSFWWNPNYQDQETSPIDPSGRGPIVGVNGGSGSDPIELELGMNDGLSIKADYYSDDVVFGLEAGRAFDADMNGVIICRVSGNTDLNDYFEKDEVNWTNDDPARVEVPVTATGNEDYSSALAIPIFRGGSRQQARTTELVNSKAEMVFGQSPQSNVGRQPHLLSPLTNGSGTNQLQYNPQTINAPVINLNQQISTIEITREVKNESGSDTNVREIGLFVKDNSDDYSNEYTVENYFLISRDVINVTIPDTETVSFSYKIRTSSEADGGIMTNFNEMLYRQFADTNRVVQDINNNDQNDGPAHRQFASRSFGGSISNLAGVMLGTSSDPVDEGNNSLGNRIPLGQQDGELYRVGSYVSDFNYDKATDESYFDLVSFFESRGSTQIDVEELGWITSGPSGNVLVARALTGSTQSISPGDLVEARFRISLTP